MKYSASRKHAPHTSDIGHRKRTKRKPFFSAGEQSSSKTDIAQSGLTDDTVTQFFNYDSGQNIFGSVATIQRNGNGDVSTEEYDLEQQKEDYHEIVEEWFDRYRSALRTNKRRARHANDRFIDFEESGISELQMVGSVAGGTIALFGGPAAVAGLCVTVLTNVAGQNLSGKSQKKAASVARLEDKLSDAEDTLDDRRDNLDDRIDNMTSAYDHSGWVAINNRVRSYGVPEVASENVLYRDLLLAFARGGDYNISGSQWNVENRSIFGDAPWYHTSDWGSPGWTNGQDIAEELNNLAEGDPSTKKDVRIN